MAETGSAKIDLVMDGDSDDLADGRGRKEGHLGEVRRGKRRKRETRAYDKILQEGIGLLEVNVGTAGQMGSLLEEEGVGAMDLADIDGDVLWDVRGGENAEKRDIQGSGRKRQSS